MKRTLAAAAGALTLAASSGAQFTFPTPSHDRWHYPFNFTPGRRSVAGCFGAAGTPRFNDRDGIVIVAWDTSPVIPAGQGAASYGIKSITVTLTNQKNAVWPVDLTVDEWFTYDVNGDDILNGDGIPRGQPGDRDGESDDADPGRPIELFGAGFGPSFTSGSWQETSIYVGSGGEENAARDPFPFVFQDGTLALLHVEDSVKGLHNDGLPQPVPAFTPRPWAVGATVNYVPGSQPVPFDVVFEVDLTLSAGAVRRYFQEQVNTGRIAVIATSMRETTVQGSATGYPSFFMKEGLFLDAGARAARLDLHVCRPARPDFDQDCDVDVGDLERLRDCRTGPRVAPPPGSCTEPDLDHDGDIDHDDFGTLQRCLSGTGIEPDPDCEGN